ncbi:hypothetical protein L0337_00650 [candidate division KSB1 bacterium]|nr:hypothetical protein [candidate division KSB1 bacterium]
MPDYNLEKLDQIEHIVVLMLENRSFDHMLGFLSLPKSKGGRGRNDVDGLKKPEDHKIEYEGKVYTPQALADEHLNFLWDPCHEHKCVQQQLANDNRGFVENFATHHHQLVKERPLTDPGLIMGYYTARQLPVYDNLAEQFCVCDCWFSSMPGPTIPNRLYALAGTSDGETDNPPAAVPFRSYDLKTIYEFLPPGAWKHFADDVSSLLYFKKYRKIKTMVKVLSDNSKTFLQLAKKGKLPALSWIDPNFASWPPGSKAGNDDHPPLNVQQGQKLVGQIYNALRGSPKWDKTLFVVTYDEHGGFYDHVTPKKAEDNWALLQSYGVRVPALVISPWVGKRAVSHEIFDHTSILKTVLLRFCRQSDGSIPHMSERVDAATPLSVLLTETHARKDCKPAPQVSASRGVAPKSDSTDFQNLMRALREDALSE